MVIVNEHDNHDRQRLDSSLVYIGAHNVYYVKSCLSDAKCFSGSRYSFRVQELKPLLFHNWPVHGESGYTVKPPTGDTNEQTQFIDYFNLFYSKRGQEQISISQQLGNYGTTFFSASRQSYWNTSRSDQQISFGLNVPFGDITTSLNYSYSNNIWQNDRDHLLAFTLNVPFSHWMRTDSQSAFRNSNASYSMSNDLKGGMTNLSGVYGTLLPDNNLNYSVQVGNTHGGNTSSGTSGYSSLNYRGAYGNTNVGYSRSGDSSQIYYGMSGGIIAHADGITFGQPLGDTMVLVKAPGADNVKIENQTGIHTDWRGYAILPFATEYRENRVALNANSLADNVELDETVVTVIPTHGAIARATFNAQIGGKVLMTLNFPRFMSGVNHLFCFIRR